MRSLALVIFALASPALFGGTALSPLTAPGDTPLVLKKGDRIAIVGNTLGELMAGGKRSSRPTIPTST
jgi:hypothetical protein